MLMRNSVATEFLHVGHDFLWHLSQKPWTLWVSSFRGSVWSNVWRKPMVLFRVTWAGVWGMR